MAYANTTVRHAGFGIRDRIAALVVAYHKGAERRRIYRKTVEELSLLSDRDLGDLGINRGMIERVALEAANGK